MKILVRHRERKKDHQIPFPRFTISIRHFSLTTTTMYVRVVNQNCRIYIISPHPSPAFPPFPPSYLTLPLHPLVFDFLFLFFSFSSVANIKNTSEGFMIHDDMFLCYVTSLIPFILHSRVDGVTNQLLFISNIRAGSA